MARTLVTTSDNKFNPFTQFDRWIAYDEKECGYNTLAYLARVASLSNELSPAEYSQAVEDACDEICKMDLRFISPATGEEVCYVKVTEQD